MVRVHFETFLLKHPQTFSNCLSVSQPPPKSEVVAPRLVTSSWVLQARSYKLEIHVQSVLQLHVLHGACDWAQAPDITCCFPKHIAIE